MTLFQRLCVLLVVGFVISGCSARGGDSSSHPSSDPTLASIQIGPGTSKIAPGTAQNFSATAIYSDGTKADVTSSVAWASSDPHIATIGNTPADAGASKALNPGVVQIKATLENISSTASLSVSSATLSQLKISAPATNIAAGVDQQLLAIALFSDGTWQDVTESATWGSSNSSVATVQDLAGSKGRIKGIAAGQTSIFASFASTPASVGLTVTAATLQKISLVPTATSFAKGTTVSVRAIATFSDNSVVDITKFSTWSSSNTAIISTISAPPAGQIAVGAGPGSAQLTAAYLGVSGSISLMVTEPTLDKLQIELNQATVAKGLSRRLKSVGIFSDGSKQDLTLTSVWTSAGPEFVTVENSAQSAGVVTGVSVGTSSIRAKALGKSASSIVTVSAATPDQLSLWPVAQKLAVGSSLPFTAAILLSDNTSQNVTADSFWTVDDPAIAQLGAGGRKGQSVTGKAAGTTAVSAAFQGKSTSTPATVTAATPTTLSITPSNPTIAVGTVTSLKASAVFSDGSTQDVTSYVTWGSSLTTSVAVSNADSSRGLARGLASGTASITAKYLGLTATSSVVVSGASVSSIAVTPANPTLAKNTSLQLKAVATLSDGALQDITTDAVWGVSAESVASIANLGKSSGRLATQGQGNATITAKYAGATGSAALTVTAATLQTLSVSPVAPSIAKNATQAFTATAKFSDGSSLDVTDATTWKSSDTAIAAISNAKESRGLAQGLAAGSTTINAYYQQTNASATLSVLPASITSIEVLPASPSLAVGSSQQFTATVHYSDGTSDNVTALVNWGSSNASIATISNVSGSSGLAQANAPGTTTISAIYAGHAGSTVMTVTAATP